MKVTCNHCNTNEVDFAELVPSAVFHPEMGCFLTSTSCRACAQGIRIESAKKIESHGSNGESERAEVVQAWQEFCDIHGMTDLEEFGFGDIQWLAQLSGVVA